MRYWIEIDSSNEDHGELIELVRRDELTEVSELEIALEEQGKQIRELRAQIETLKAERDRREFEAREMAEAFMKLHNIAKIYVGPKPAIDQKPMPGAVRPTFGEMMKAAEGIAH